MEQIQLWNTVVCSLLKPMHENKYCFICWSLSVSVSGGWRHATVNRSGLTRQGTVNHSGLTHQGIMNHSCLKHHGGLTILLL